MNMIEVRRIKEADYKEVGDMIKLVIQTSFKSVYPQALRDAFCEKYDLDKFKLKVKGIQYFVAVQSAENGKEKIVGIIGKKENQLRTFFVHPNFQGQSIGSKLYARLEKEMKMDGIEKIVLEGSPLGEPVYKHFGFSKIKEITKERDGIPFVDAVMEKEL